MAFVFLWFFIPLFLFVLTSFVIHIVVSRLKKNVGPPRLWWPLFLMMVSLLSIGFFVMIFLGALVLLGPWVTQVVEKYSTNQLFFAPLVIFWISLSALPTALYRYQLAKNLKEKKNVIKNPRFSENQILVGVVVFMIFFFLLVAVFFGVGGHNPQASKYFKLHAAIKNTCLIDPRKEHCPTTLVELSYIEPEEFAERSQDAQMFYHMENGQYTFVVRYNRDSFVIFDQRLVSKFGVDFIELKKSNLTKEDEIQSLVHLDEWFTVPKWNR